jgi:hypothetical protein
LIEKKYLPDSSNRYGGSFKYIYSKMSNEMCDINKYESDNNQQLFIDSYNGWLNEKCDSQTNNIGSCRNINKECIDFVQQDFCKKYNMTWSEKSCHDPLDYQWVDRINLKLPKLKDDGKFIMFDNTDSIF